MPPNKKHNLYCNDPSSSASLRISNDCLIIDRSPAVDVFAIKKSNKDPAKKAEEEALSTVFGYFDNLVENEGTQSSFIASKREEKVGTHIVQVQRIQLKWTKELSELCHLSKNLYNQANFLARELFFDIMKENHNYINKSLWKELYHKVKDSEHYTSLNVQTAILIVKNLVDNWKSYKEGVKNWFIDPSSFPGCQKPRIPGYKPKNGEFIVIFPIQNLRYTGYRAHFEQSKKVQHWIDKKGIVHSKTTAEIKFPKKTKIPPVRFRIDVNGIELNLDMIKEFRIIPRGNYYIFEVIYEKKIENLNLNPNRAIGVDLGVNNLLTIANNFGAHPIIVKGKRIKHANWLGNKQDAKIKKVFYEKLDDMLLNFLKSYLYDDQTSTIQILNYLLKKRLFKEGISRTIIQHINTVLSINEELNKSSKEYYRNDNTKNIIDFHLIQLGEERVKEIRQYIINFTKFILEYEKIRLRNWKNRNNRVQDQLHKSSRYLIEYCKKHNVNLIVIGYNEGWKQNVKLGKKNSQNFVSIPFLYLVEKIEYKARLLGIDIIRVNENHTSKCSALDFESICHHNLYMGKRVKRGLFLSKDGLYINSDVNGAFNILRQGIEGILDRYRYNEKNLKLMLLSPISKTV